MFTLALIVWSIIIAGVVRKISTYRINFDFSDSDSDSDPDDDMVGHSSLSETEEMEKTQYSDSESESDHLDSDSEFYPEDEEIAHILLHMSLNNFDKIPEYMKDFYEEAILSPEWMSLTDDQKKAKLDAELNTIQKKQA